MRKLYEKSELTFSLVFIVVYVVLFSAADALSAELGIEKSITAAIGFLMSAVIFIWIKKNGLMKKYGLCPMEKGKLTAADVLFFLFVLSANLWNGVTYNLGAAETVCYILSMLFVGFIEEMIFRGFLFKALLKDNMKTAVIVSSLTFGAGHIVNLLNSAEITETLLQICYASAIGFAFTAFFLKKGSLMPCILLHSVFNSLSVFSVEASGIIEIVTAVILTVVPLIYGVLLFKKSVKIIDN